MDKIEHLKNSKVMLEIPMVRQLIPEEDWGLGANFKETREYWSNRACGIACLKMAINYFNGISPTLPELITEAVSLSGYSSKGWIHAKLLEVATRYGLNGFLKHTTCFEQGVSPIIDERHLVIASVAERFPIDGRKGGHLVLIKGVLEERDATMIAFNDPSAWGQVNALVSLHRFNASFSGNIIVLYSNRDEINLAYPPI